MIKDKVKLIKSVVVRMLYPDSIKCAVCDEEMTKSSRYGVCDNCKLDVNDLFCEHCGRAIKNMARFCDECITYGKKEYTYARSAVEVNDSARKMVHRLKYGNEKWMARYMAEYMLDTYYECMLDPDVITFVPMHEKRQKKRGYNQAEILANIIGEHAKVDVKSLLVKTTNVTNMAKLNMKERAETIKNSFKIDTMCDIKGKSILLIDDIFTTGATTSECAKCLFGSGASEVIVLTFASVSKSPDLY